MSSTDDRTDALSARRTHVRRLRAGLISAVVAGVDLGAKAWATSSLRDRVVDLGPLDLRLAYNPGVAFSLGSNAPGWLVVAVTAALTAAVAVYAWRTAARGSLAQLIAAALVLGGAAANVLDRARDGVVTDYLHTGWWPTFNLADTAIVCGALLLVLTSFWNPTDHPVAAPDPAVSAPPAEHQTDDGPTR